jgi:ferrous iron transport protein A
MWSVKLRPKHNATRERHPTPRDANAIPRTLADLSPGERAQIACLECAHAASCERLMAYGLVQGQSVLLVQKYPAFVIRIDETELALDELVARCIQVEAVGE